MDEGRAHFDTRIAARRSRVGSCMPRARVSMATSHLPRSPAGTDSLVRSQRESTGPDMARTTHGTRKGHSYCPRRSARASRHGLERGCSLERVEGPRLVRSTSSPLQRGSRSVQRFEPRARSPGSGRGPTSSAARS
jgi:hypothetical protein